MRPSIGSLTVTLMALTAVLLRAGASESSASDQSDFLKELNASMMKMHAAMNIPPTGNIDADFVALMTPHHQGAIDMAQIQLHYGHNEQLRRIAQEIIVEQQQEIVAMKRALATPVMPGPK